MTNDPTNYEPGLGSIMALNSSDSNTPRSGGWLDRLKAMAASLATGDPPPTASEARPPEKTAQPHWDGAAVAAPVMDLPTTSSRDGVPAAAPIREDVPLAAPVESVPLTAPVADAPPDKAEHLSNADESAIFTESAADPLEQATPDELALLPAFAEEELAASPTTIILEPEPEPKPSIILCPVCQSQRHGERESCVDCGYYFAPADLNGGGTTPAATAMPIARLQNRYEIRERLGERQGIERFRGLDHGDGSQQPVPIMVVRQVTERQPDAAAESEVANPPEDSNDEIMPSFDEALTSGSPPTEVIPNRPGWPNVSWERGLLRTLEQPLLPKVLASFIHENHEYLIEEIPTGRSLWDAWDDPDSTNDQRFGWLVHLAEGLASMHHCNVMLEAIRPGLVVIDDGGQVRLTDVADLLPLPIPPGAPLHGTLYTAPEIMAGNGSADARAGLYSFGAMLYALHVGRELQEIDFDRPGHPKPFIPRFPDIHPGFGRLVTKTFRREPASRFPTDEASKEDSTGFLELIRTLGVLRRTFDLVRVEIASWTTTGIVRTGNEDAYALLHACESRQDDLGEQVLILLADGMGGYEAGEVAAALALQVMRQNLLQQKPFAALAGKSPFPTDVLSPVARPEGHAAEPCDVGACKQLIKAALKDANRQVFQASRAPGSKRRGMGCTAEAVFLDGRNVVVGHVGDSRTYHLHEGRMIQLTRDQTLVNRLVELGTLTAEEAETHPRRNELQQAIGGQPDVEPGLYHGILKPGDWIVVCSDGLTNHVSSLSLKEMLLSEAQSAEMAARRLVNLTNIEGATDNATVVVVRCT